MEASAVPVKAMFVYKVSGDAGISLHDPYSSKPDHHYVESCDILQGQDGAFQYGARKPLSLSTVNRLLEGFLHDRLNAYAGLGLMPERLLGYSPQGSIVWWVPSGVRHLFIKKERTGFESGKAHLPSLLFRVNGSSMWVFALKGDTRPQADTPLFQAPFWNTNSNGAVCLGNAKIEGKAATWDELLVKLEGAFFNSYFSHTGGATTKRTKKFPTFDSVWEAVLVRGQKFPLAVLHPANRTVGQVIANLDR